MKEIKNLFNKGISYGYSPYEVFDDFLNVVVISLINATNKWGKRFQEYEQQFKSIIDRYDGKDEEVKVVEKEKKSEVVQVGLF